MINNQIIYQIFVRNYSLEGTFSAVERDLPRIKALGADIVYLMPIHEIGVLNRKGTYGSPYAIKDYYSITPDYGTLDDFKSLIKATHDLGMKIIIDMVFNHTSPDNVLVKEHSEYYFYKNGKRGNRVGDWSDIVDLDHSRSDVQEYLVNVLKYWVDIGVDGFRFDVASMIPLSFFKKARKELGDDIIFIAESIDVGFHIYLKSVGIFATNDEDMFPTFDSLYNYSWYRELECYFRGKVSLSTLVDALRKDEELLYNLGTRLNCLENHDNERIASFLHGDKLKSIISFLGFIKGNMFIYMGQEYGTKHKPELFEKDPVVWKENKEIYNAYIEAIKEKKSLSFKSEDKMVFTQDGDSIIAEIKGIKKRFTF